MDTVSSEMNGRWAMDARGAEASGDVVGPRDAEPIGEGDVCRVPPDLLVPIHTWRDVLEAIRQRGQTQITFEGLRKSCLLALETDDSETGALSAAQGAVAELASAAAAVAAARIVYHYVKLNHVWSVTKDRRDRLYYLASVLDTLDWIQGRVILQEQEQDRMGGVEGADVAREGVAPRRRLVAPAAMGPRPRNGGSTTFNVDLTCV